jgi:hypothetical protein
MRTTHLGNGAAFTIILFVWSITWLACTIRYTNTLLERLGILATNFQELFWGKRWLFNETLAADELYTGNSIDHIGGEEDAKNGNKR